jgi:inosine-uridine nucleoside N-ribohydrolase
VATPILIDCDPGHDDAMALLLALASPELELLGVTTVHGNQTLEKTTANALRVLEFAGRGDVPVAAGADRPLVREPRVAAHVHGESGLDGPDLPPPVGTPVPEHAVEFLADRLRSADRPMTLIPTGPLTNIALLLAQYPDAPVERIVLMGGAIAEGNMTPAAEFNIWIDPEAAARVFASTSRASGPPGASGRWSPSCGTSTTATTRRCTSSRARRCTTRWRSRM